MNPQQKAKQIYDKYVILTWIKLDEIETLSVVPETKKCAILSVDLILEELESYSDLESSIIKNNFSFSVIELIGYWKEVKSELEKL